MFVDPAPLKTTGIAHYDLAVSGLDGSSEHSGNSLDKAMVGGGGGDTGRRGEWLLGPEEVVVPPP